jgi:hypothetical protein
VPELEANVDLYGSQAHRSCLADFLELEAISGRKPGEQHLADYISDAGWNVLTDERYFEPSGGQSSRTFDPLDVSRQVFATVEDRLATLGEARYPFKIVRGRIAYSGPDSLQSPYLALLAITVAHAYSIPLSEDPEDLLPALTAGVLNEVGVRAVSFTDLRKGRTFVEALSATGEALLLDATPEEGLRSINVNDAGADVVASVGWGDHRAGAWAFIGQATCGKSESWRGKALEGAPGSWSKFLNTQIRPVRFLAIPHHAEPMHFAWLVQETDALVLDRLRLAMFKTSVTTGERQACETVYAQIITHLY